MVGWELGSHPRAGRGTPTKHQSLLNPRTCCVLCSILISGGGQLLGRASPMRPPHPPAKLPKPLADTNVEKNSTYPSRGTKKERYSRQQLLHTRHVSLPPPSKRAAQNSRMALGAGHLHARPCDKLQTTSRQCKSLRQLSSL